MQWRPKQVVRKKKKKNPQSQFSDFYSLCEKIKLEYNIVYNELVH